MRKARVAGDGTGAGTPTAAGMGTRTASSKRAKQSKPSGGAAPGGLWTQLRHPPGGRDARTMLTAQFLDRTGTGVWSAAAVLYFTVEAGFDARRVGVLLGLGGVAGVLGSPIAGRLAGARPVRTLLICCHLLRLVTLCAILSSTSFAVLLPAVALTIFGDRAAKTLEMLFATQVAGRERATYQALFRSVANMGFVLGAGIAAIGLAVGTRDAYRVLILLDALSFAGISLLVRRIPAVRLAEQTDEPVRPPGTAAPNAATQSTSAQGVMAVAATGPWRDPGYLRFVLLDIVMTTDDSVINVGLPLWLLTHTSAPHALVPLFLVVNSVLVVALQMRVSAATKGPRDATKAVARYGLIMLACCGCLAAAAECGPWLASSALMAAACLQTLAELMRSVSSWELAVSLAPGAGRAAYLGVAGMSQSVQKCVGPLVLTGVVMAAGPLGWIGLGAGVATGSVLQRRGCLRRLDHRAGRATARARLDPAG
jgi:Major Facilitator Superfamily